MAYILSQHPCFDEEARHKYSRVHLPVAPLCNVQCNYCNRKYDCSNECRPGLTSAVLSPAEALRYLVALDRQIPHLSVCGIAGPGDPFANPAETMQTIRLIHNQFPDKIICLSTNGLDMSPYIDEIATSGVSHITVTINSLRPSTLARIYRWIRYRGRLYRGIEAGEILLQQQLGNLVRLKEHGVTVKINTVVCPGINDYEIAEIAEHLAALGADTMNCIPIYPIEESAFADLPPVTPRRMKAIKTAISTHLKPMIHCTRCRADAAGLLGCRKTIKDYGCTALAD